MNISVFAQHLIHVWGGFLYIAGIAFILLLREIKNQRLSWKKALLALFVIEVIFAAMTVANLVSTPELSTTLLTVWATRIFVQVFIYIRLRKTLHPIQRN
ncbi:MAG: hypothetical protein QHH24_06325 [Candidatus Bathyarchaeota archaeon]|nr:hypothetical protein [Candidatus Bathyarchaeota archaeon]